MLANLLRRSSGPYIVTETLTYNGIRADSTGTSTRTFANVNVGPGHTGRRIILCLQFALNGADTSVSSVTVGGVSVTQLPNCSVNSGGVFPAYARRSWMGIATVESGDSLDVVVAFHGDVDRCIIATYTLDSALSTYSGSNDTSSPFEASISPSSGDFLVAIGRANSTETETWSNITEDGEQTVVGATRFSIASRKVSSGGAVTVTYTPSSTSNAHMCLARISA